MAKSPINTADEAIDRLGGTAKLARLLAVGDNVVSNWRTRGFPPGRYFEVGALLKEKRIKFSPALFGFKDMD
jgi:hypothetical protein